MTAWYLERTGPGGEKHKIRVKGVSSATMRKISPLDTHTLGIESERMSDRELLDLFRSWAILDGQDVRWMKEVA